MPPAPWIPTARAWEPPTPHLVRCPDWARADAEGAEDPEVAGFAQVLRPQERASRVVLHFGRPCGHEVVTLLAVTGRRLPRRQSQCDLSNELLKACQGREGG
ncbi:hypothetical protein GCM10023084_73710 [Streptomyces lacrimifluminis]|uniref:Uncharacterized protein n=1 Tax=Streptomyces lacrimifluminis TaxID=1500077 RepID=A0A917UKS7_9ACTN|nr:hypothetical protein GCM10012282_72370 [Streptomyces lacrimifluminis]